MGIILGGIVILVLMGIGAHWDAGNGPIVVLGLLFIGALCVPGSMLTLGAIQERKRRRVDLPPAAAGDNAMLIGGLLFLAAAAGLAWLVFGVLT